MKSCSLTDVDLQHRVRVLMPPSPISLLILGTKPVEIPVLAMVLLHVHAIRPVFAVIPMMFVVVISILVHSIMFVSS